MINIILCGGNGTRLWPISRNLMPKQFVPLFEHKSLFELTVERNYPLCDKLMIISNADQYFLALDILEKDKSFNTKNSSFLLEPIGRNTAPAIALACMALEYETIVLITPSDHLIKNDKEYLKVLTKANKLAQEDNLVTFGIKASFAETGFGYIEADGLDVQAFHEKPDLKTATSYVKAGNYYWNSGMFCFKAGIFLDELKEHSLDIYENSLLAYNNSTNSNNIRRIKLEDMLNIKEDSIDYAVMEKSNKVKAVPSDIGWSDVGSFDSLFNELPKDRNNNTINSKHISINSKNNLIYGDSRYISTIDIEDLIIVDTADAILISKKQSSQKVKQIVQKIKKNTDLHNIHLTGNRPWGTYTILGEDKGYKIKKIVVQAGKRLSLQKHFHRSEHWVIISGTATVTIGSQVKELRANESTYIKIGEIHRLENKGKIPIVLIEVQVGEYTGEDDIVRIEDDFSRI